MGHRLWPRAADPRSFVCLIEFCHVPALRVAYQRTSEREAARQRERRPGANLLGRSSGRPHRRRRSDDGGWLRRSVPVHRRLCLAYAHIRALAADSPGAGADRVATALSDPAAHHTGGFRTRPASPLARLNFALIATERRVKCSKDVSGFTQDQIINDLLNRYARFRHARRLT